MKQLCVLALSALLITACQNSETTNYTRTSPEIDTAMALVKDYEAGNWEAWTSHYADTAKLYHNNWKVGATPQETADNFKDVLSNFSSYGFEVVDDLPWYEMVVNDKDDTWVYVWGNWQGTLSANDKQLNIPVHLSLKFDNGKITREEAYYNMAEFAAAMAELEAASAAEEEESADAEE